MQRDQVVSIVVSLVASCGACSSFRDDAGRVERRDDAAAEPPTYEDDDVGEGPAPGACPEAPVGFRPMASFATIGPEATRFDRLIAEAVWTGREALFLGTTAPQDCPACRALVAGAYDPAVDRWRPLPAPPLPVDARLRAFWTGSTWALFDEGGRGASGAELDLATTTWTTIPDPPGERRLAAAYAWVPTTHEVVSWGGQVPGAPPAEVTVNRGAAYSFVTRTWRTIPESPIGPRTQARAAWDGRRVVFAWGFVYDVDAETTTAAPGVAAWDPQTNRWEALPDPGATPRLREVDETVGRDLAAFFGGPPRLGDGDFWIHAADGVAWDSRANAWRSIPEAPLGGLPYRGGYAHWTANGRLYVWGGDSVQETEPFFLWFDDGASWDSRSGTWTPLPSGGPSPRTQALAVWTGCDAIVYGGSTSGRPYVNDGMILRP